MHPVKSPFSELVDELNALAAERNRNRQPRQARLAKAMKPTAACSKLSLAQVAAHSSQSMAQFAAQLDRMLAAGQQTERRNKLDARSTLIKAFNTVDQRIKGAIGRVPGHVIGEADVKLRMLVDQAIRAGLL